MEHQTSVCAKNLVYIQSRARPGRNLYSWSHHHSGLRERFSRLRSAGVGSDSGDRQKGSRPRGGHFGADPCQENLQESPQKASNSSSETFKCRRTKLTLLLLPKPSSATT